jgi:hypothetical protein
MGTDGVSSKVSERLIERFIADSSLPVRLRVEEGYRR